MRGGGALGGWVLVLWVLRFGLGDEGPAARGEGAGLCLCSAARYVCSCRPEAELRHCLCLCLGSSKPRFRLCPGTAGPGRRPGSGGSEAGPGRAAHRTSCGGGGARPALGSPRAGASGAPRDVSLCWGGPRGPAGQKQRLWCRGSITGAAAFGRAVTEACCCHGDGRNCDAECNLTSF